MIVDCHHHVIQHWVGACGHDSSVVHKRFAQQMLARAVCDVYRVGDGARVDGRALMREGEVGWAGLTDVGFRIGRFGQYEFTVDGEDYQIQYMPVGMQELRAPPELALAQMRYAGVDHAVLHAGALYGAMTDYNLFAQAQYPERFTALAWVEEAMAGEPGNLAHLRRAHEAHGVKGVYFNLEGFARRDFAWTIEDERLDPFFALIDDLGLVLCAELSAAPGYDKAGYVANLLRLGRILDRHRGIRCHLAMGPPVQHFAAAGAWDFPQDVLAVYRHERLWVEVMFPITWGGRWDYPYPEARPLVRGLRDLLGADRLMWGSDMPNVERFCTYRQSLDYVLRYCDFLSDAEMELILGGNAVGLYEIQKADGSG
jgi:predicted TIM-barrel fold metal-dependent hydrolase